MSKQKQSNNKVNSSGTDDEAFRVNSLHYILFLIFRFTCVARNLLDDARCNVLIEIIFTLSNKGGALLYFEKLFTSRLKCCFTNTS